MKRDNIIYWVATGLLSAMMLFSSIGYIFNYDMVSEVFTSLGFPVFIIYPLAIAKILGIAAIVSNLSKWLKEWAYAGFFFDFLLALGAHLNAADGGYLLPIVAIALVLTSYMFNKRVHG